MKTWISILLVFIVLTGCNNTNELSTNRSSIEKSGQQAGKNMDFQGIIVEKHDGGVRVVVGLTEKEVIGKTTEEIISQYEPEIYDVSTININTRLQVGDHVKVWTNGMYEESRIVRTAATKIEVVR
jgi:hypothetical protein